MSITLSRVEYSYFGSITIELADFLDTIASEATPSRMHISKDNQSQIEKLRDYAKSSPDDADSIEYILKYVEEKGEIDIAWG